ncbi:unnamed protein product [Adineta steineri]|uniref:NHL repeat containing protein n=1 Tax=Adineta steineri TaxID=433720 RepID=A0A818W0F7_9BILA|nr:unnamed protein product [Adineta steineri]
MTSLSNIFVDTQNNGKIGKQLSVSTTTINRSSVHVNKTSRPSNNQNHTRNSTVRVQRVSRPPSNKVHAQDINSSSTNQKNPGDTSFTSEHGLLRLNTSRDQMSFNKKKKYGKFQITQCCCFTLIAAAIIGVLLAIVAAIVATNGKPDQNLLSVLKQQQQRVPQVPLQVHPRRHRLQQLRLAQVRVHQQAALQVVQAQVHQLVPLQPVQVHQQALLQLVQAQVHQHQQALLQRALQLALHRQHVTSTTTTAFNSCNNLRWNQIGQTVAGTTTHGSGASELNNPSCLYIDNNNTLYICDHDNNRIQKWVQGASAGTTVAGDSAGHQGSTSALLNNPIDLTFDENGFMYVVDHDNFRVQRFAPGSTNGVTVAGTTGSNSGALTKLDKPTAIGVDNNSNIYILDTNNKRLVEWTPNATSGTLVISDNDMNNDYDILLVPNSSNLIYISDQNSKLLGLWTFGASSPSMTYQTVNDSQHSLSNPSRMVLDPYGNLYVADRDNDRIVMFCANSTVGIVVAEDGNSGPSLKKPVDLAFDSDLNLYLVSIDSDQVVKLSRI